MIYFYSCVRTSTFQQIHFSTFVLIYSFKYIRSADTFQQIHTNISVQHTPLYIPHFSTIHIKHQSSFIHIFYPHQNMSGTDSDIRKLTALKKQLAICSQKTDALITLSKNKKPAQKKSTKSTSKQTSKKSSVKKPTSMRK